MGLEWRNFRVEDIAAEQPNALATGPFGSAISAKFFVGEGVPVIRGSNLSTDIGVRLIDENMVFVSPEKAKEFSRSLVKRGDLVFTCWGTINQVGLIDERSRWHEYIVSNKQMKLTVDPDKAHSTYIYYVFSSPEKQQEILSNGIGAAVPGFNLGQLKKHMLRLPPLETQEAIVRRIQSIDDKVDLNRRINQTLEAMTQAIFKSWFVHFDPVKAKIAAIEQGEDPLRAAMRAISGKTDAELDQMPREYHDQLAATAALFPHEMEGSDLGEIPKGWAVSALGSVTNYLSRGISPKYLENGGVLVLNQKCIRDFRVDESKGRRHDPTQRKIDGRALELGDVLVNSTGVGTLGRVAQVLCLSEPTIVDSHVTVVRASHQLNASYLGQYIIWKHPDIEAMGEGSTGQTELSRAKLAELPVLTPRENVLKAFDNLISPLNNEISANDRESVKLAELRNTLLPKLLSGELSVSDMSKLANTTGAA